MSDENAPGQDERTWSDLHDEGLYALECEEFEKAMEHWSDMFECMPIERIPEMNRMIAEDSAVEVCAVLDAEF